MEIPWDKLRTKLERVAEAFLDAEHGTGTLTIRMHVKEWKYLGESVGGETGKGR